jgi:hypothetical protein
MPVYEHIDEGCKCLLCMQKQKKRRKTAFGMINENSCNLLLVLHNVFIDIFCVSRGTYFTACT